MPVIGDRDEIRRDIWMLGVHILVTLGGKLYHLAQKPEERQALYIVRALGPPSPAELQLVPTRPSCGSM
jgi:hypothetical protein